MQNDDAKNAAGVARAALVCCFALALVLMPRVCAGQADSANEYELKAAMLYNLTRFVEWPASSYPDAQAPILLCILGRDPFGKTLSTVTSGKSVNARALAVRHAENLKDARGCQVLYISSSEKKNFDQILSGLKGSNVLTVGEMGQFAARGGMVQFSLEEKQVRFQINLDAASRADLRISSRLLVLARIVKDQASGSQSSAL